MKMTPTSRSGVGKSAPTLPSHGFAGGCHRRRHDEEPHLLRMGGRNLTAGGLALDNLSSRPHAPQLGSLFCLPSQFNMASNPSGRCRVFTISLRVGLQMVRSAP
jgi:hypothetical protein